MRTLLVAFSFVLLSLAGCADEASTPDADPGAPLSAGTGAIQGLLIDDRFRPIGAATVLLFETGDSTTTNDDGEFVFVDLEPGVYTLRITADGHEASPTKVNVDADAYADANVVARRVINNQGEIVTREYAIFIPCNAYATLGCTYDASGDSFRPGIYDSFEDYQPDLTYSVWEVLLNNPYIFCFEVRESSGTGASLDRHFANWCRGQDSTYLKGILQVNATYDEERSRDPWDPAADTEAILFTFGNNEALCWMKPGGPETPATPNPDNRYRCAGVGFAIKAQIIVTFFLSEPEVDLEEYCVLC